MRRCAAPWFALLAICTPMIALAAAARGDDATERKAVQAGLEKVSARLDKQGNLLADYVVYVPVVETVLVHEGDATRPVAVTRLVPQVRTQKIGKDAFRLFDAEGRRQGPMAVEKHLKDKREVFITHEKMPDAELLKKLPKDGLLVVITLPKKANPDPPK